MKTIDQLIQKAVELQAGGLLTGQIADELNVSRETATWLLVHARKGDSTAAPKDIYIDWSNIGRSSNRQRLIANSLTDMVIECLSTTENDIDVIVGIALSGIPLANLIADELGVEFATYHPNKQKSEELKNTGGTISQNFAQVSGKNCVLIDDVVTSGTTLTEAISVLENLGAKPVAIAVLIDKKGIDKIAGVPLNALLRVTRVDKTE